ncbi:MAG: type I 3-dehydroquinate dehydratase [Verrucomicrobia bacterium]|nr:MAG: type I 3-dehydroquinate dehydratase [Verrucomicrobiota bacterium]
MNQHVALFPPQQPQVVGSFGSMQDLLDCTQQQAISSCDWIEIRLDILCRDGWKEGEKPWGHLQDLPILFTARCQSEGGVLALSSAQRHSMISAVLDDAAAVDVELAQCREMAESLLLLRDRKIPWIASMHHFTEMPSMDHCREARETATTHGASVYKLATYLPSVESIATLEEFQRESATIPVSSMGMGPYAAASRVRCALAGSVLNYGYIGQAPTAPGQWPAAALREAIRLREIPAIA